MQHTQTLTQCIRANAERIGAFLIGAAAVSLISGAFFALLFITWTSGSMA